MATPNPILRLARRALRRKYDRCRLRRESRDLRGKVASADDVYAVLEWMVTRPRSIRAMVAVVRICHWYLLLSGERDLAGRVLCEAGKVFRERLDHQYLRFAASCYRRGRALLEQQDVGYGAAIIAEGVVLCRLAEVGVAPEANAVRALGLCQEAEPFLALDLSLLARALMIGGRAHWLLAEATTANRRENLNEAVRRCQGARELYDEYEPGGQNAIAARSHEGSARNGAAGFGIEPHENYARAAELYRQARLHLGPETHDAGEFLTNEGLVLLGLADVGDDPVGHTSEAVSLFQESRRLLRADHPEYRTKYNRALVNEAKALTAMAALGVDIYDSLRAAIQLCREARADAAAATPEYGGALWNEAAAHHVLANFGENVKGSLREAVRLYAAARERFPHDSGDYRRILAQESEARIRLAELEEDELWAGGRGLDAHLARFDEALAAVRASCADVDPGSPDSGLLLGVAARLHARRAGTYIRAIRQQELRLSGGLQAGLSSLRIPDVAAAIREDLNLAVDLHRESRRGWAAGSLGHAYTLLHEAGDRLRLADWGGAQIENRLAANDLARRAAESFTRGDPSWCEAQGLRARACRAAGEGDAARELLREVIDATEQMRSRMRREGDRITFLEDADRHYAEMIRLCHELSVVAPAESADRLRREAWHYAHRAKSRALLDLLGSVRPHLQPECRPLWDEYRCLADKLDDRSRHIRWLRDRLGAAAVPEGVRPEAEARLAAALAERDGLDRECEQLRQLLIERAGDAMAIQTVAVPPPSETYRHLREMAAAVAAGRAKPSTPVEDRPLLVEFFLLDHDEVAIFLLPLWGEESPPEVLVLPPAGVVVGTLMSFTAALDAFARERAVVPDQAHSSPLDQFDRVASDLGRLVEPWGEYLEKWCPTQLVLSPHSRLALLPLHAAPWKGRPLIESFPVVYLPSPAHAPELVKRRRQPGGEALLVGNPTGDLPGAEAEVAAVARWVRNCGMDPTVLVRSDANTGGVVARSHAASVVHFACHSVLDEEDFSRSGVQLADRRLNVPEMVATLELPRATLAVLSSCDSARNTLGSSTELLALVRVFFYAGAPSVVASLWPLNDAVGTYFADFFYKYWMGDRKPLAVAVQQATLRVREEYPNPCHWAPFVLMGIWSTVVGEKPTRE